MPHFTGLKLPSRSRIAAFLQQAGLTRKYERYAALPQSQAADPQRAHGEWEMDAQGAMKLPDLGWVSVINIVDLFGGVNVGSWPCLNPAHLSTPDHQLALRQAFVRLTLSTNAIRLIP